MNKKKFRLKPLRWKRRGFSYWESKTPFGNYTFGADWYINPEDGFYWTRGADSFDEPLECHKASSLREAMKTAEFNYRRRVREMFEEVL